MDAHSLPFESAAAALGTEGIERFSRQMLVEEFGATKMDLLRQRHAVCVGAGGLGSTNIMYLAAAGVGRLSIVDFDVVEESNLHRQVIHSTGKVGQAKAESARDACLAIYPEADVRVIIAPISPTNAENIFRDCDVVVDGTDNVASRYIINDAAMRCKKPLVSGSAIGWDGQLSVYGYKGGPCYRCLFPVPPPAAAVGSCGDSGVMGPVPGMIGCLQALEVIKVLTDTEGVLSGRLFTFSGLQFRTRVVQLRGRQPTCAACGDTAAALDFSLPEYGQTACSTTRPSLPSENECSVEAFGEALAFSRDASPPFAVLDVRTSAQYDIAHLRDTVCVPYADMVKKAKEGTLIRTLGEIVQAKLHTCDGGAPFTLYFLCRRGINSAKAVSIVLETIRQTLPSEEDQFLSSFRSGLLRLVNVDGGLNAYSKRVDKRFPYY